MPRKFKAAFRMKKFKGYTDVYKEANRQAVKGLAIETRNAAVKLLTQVSKGAEQVRYSPRREVTVSLPGDPPNTDLGTLRQSIKVEQDDRFMYVGTNLTYGKYLEFGTNRGLKARPWLSVAFNMIASKADEIRKKYFKNYLKANRP